MVDIIVVIMKMIRLNRYLFVIPLILGIFLFFTTSPRCKVIVEDGYTGSVFIINTDQSSCWRGKKTISLDSLGIVKLNRNSCGVLNANDLCFTYKSSGDKCMKMVHSKKRYDALRKEGHNVMVFTPVSYSGSFRLLSGEYVELRNGYLKMQLDSVLPNRADRGDLIKKVEAMGYENFMSMKSY